MVRFKDFIKNGARWVMDKGKKIINTVSKIASPVASVIAQVPGKIGMIGAGVKAASDVLHKLTSQIPNQDVRNKVNGAIDKGVGIVERGAKAVGSAAEKIKPVVDGIAKFATGPG